MVFAKMARLCINIQKKIKKAIPFINLSFLEMRLKQLHFTGMIVMEMVYMMRMMSMNVMKLFARLRSGTSSAEGYFSIDKNGDVQILHI
ncbi:MAG: hypothetical protein ACLVGL_02080 [Waltera sp.]